MMCAVTLKDFVALRECTMMERPWKVRQPTAKMEMIQMMTNDFWVPSWIFIDFWAEMPLAFEESLDILDIFKKIIFDSPFRLLCSTPLKTKYSDLFVIRDYEISDTLKPYSIHIQRHSKNHTDSTASMRKGKQNGEKRTKLNPNITICSEERKYFSYTNFFSASFRNEYYYYDHYSYDYYYENMIIIIECESQFKRSGIGFIRNSQLLSPKQENE